MLRLYKKIIVIVSASFFHLAHAYPLDQLALLEASASRHHTASSYQFTVLNPEAYRQNVAQSRARISQILKRLQPYRQQSLDEQVALITQQLIDTPYFANDAMGEGDWQPKSQVYQPGAVHIDQQPVYRLDGLDCQTFVQTVLALLHAKSLDTFDQTYLKVAYGAAGNPNGELVRYYNRNNFIDGDFNPVNQANGWLRDATSQDRLADYSHTLTATITRQRWFLTQQQSLDDHIQVLARSSGEAMVKRFTTVYASLPFPHFDKQPIAISYLPKENLVQRESDGTFAPNHNLLAQIPTPAIAEMVRDVNRWSLYGRKIKDIIGTELTISHLGLLYRQAFKKGELIYQKTTCGYNANGRKTCRVMPVICERTQCHELMFTHATDVYPFNFFWYQAANGQMVCSPFPPPKGVKQTSCNRVISLPFFDYLTEFQQGYYWNMDMPSFLGVHLEKLL